MIMEAIGASTSIISAYLFRKEKISAWYFGIISAVFYIWVMAEAHLYGQMVFNVFLIVISIAGIAYWGKDDNQIKPWLDFDSGLNLSAIIIAFVLVTCNIMYYGKLSAEPILDGFTLSLSIVAQILLWKKHIESWVYWVVINVVCIFLMLVSGLYLTAVLFVLYLINSIIALNEWHQYVQVETV